VGSRAGLDGLAYDKISFAHRFASQKHEGGVLSALLPCSVIIPDPGRFETPDIKPAACFLL